MSSFTRRPPDTTDGGTPSVTHRRPMVHAWERRTPAPVGYDRRRRPASGLTMPGTLPEGGKA